MGEKSGETAEHGSQINILLCQIVTHYSRNMWSSVVLLKWDVVGLSLDERNDIWLNNFIPIANTGQISGDNNQWCSAMCCYASPHNSTAPTKRLTLNDAGVCISFSYTAVNTRTAITAVLVKSGFICRQDVGPILYFES